MEHLRRDWSDFLEYAKDFIEEPFVMLDIGCSGGIDEILKNFKDKIVYYGFDPNVAEIKRLNKDNENPNIYYVEAFVDCKVPEGDVDSKKAELSSFFHTNSAVEGARIIKEKIQSSHKDMVDNNLWEELDLSKNEVSISSFVKENNLEYIDFIKSDIDGLDFSFLKNIEAIIAPLNVLSIVAEVSFADNDNDEADLTNLLKKHKFALNALSTRSYSSKYLPDLYEFNIAAQSISGRITQGDALYIKDISCFKNLSPQKLLKLSIIMDLFNLTDCAAEIFNVYHKELALTGIDVKKSLELMVKQRKFLGKVSYDDFIKEFYENHDSFYPKNYPLKNLIEVYGKKIIELSMDDFFGPGMRSFGRAIFYVYCKGRNLNNYIKSLFIKIKKIVKLSA